jgi:hypothetical protein
MEKRRRSPFLCAVSKASHFDSVFQNLCKKQTRAVRAAVGLFLLALILPSLSCGGETSGGAVEGRGRFQHFYPHGEYKPPPAGTPRGRSERSTSP